MKRKHMMRQCGLLLVTLLVFAGYLTFRYSRMDRTGPEFTIAEEIPSLSVTDPKEAYLQGVTAVDDRDGDVTARILVESVYGITGDHQATVTYAAFDASGNVTKAQRQVRFTDYHSPRFTLAQALVFPETSGMDVMDYIGAEDGFDGDVVRRVRATLINNSGTLDEVGTHDVKLQVTNSLGDTAELILPVEIYAPEKYNASMELECYLVYLNVGEAFDAKRYPQTMACGSGTYSLKTPAEGLSLSVSGNVDNRTTGLYPVTYTARYERNGMVYTAYSRLFVVVEE